MHSNLFFSLLLAFVSPEESKQLYSARIFWLDSLLSVCDYYVVSHAMDFFLLLLVRCFTRNFI